MKPRVFKNLSAVFVFLALFAGYTSPALAAMCGKCRDLMFVDSQGKCIDCGGPTTSGALQLCPKCSGKRHQCEHCLAKLSEKDEAAVETAPIGPSLPEQSPHKEMDEAHPNTPAAPPAADSSPNNDGGTGAKPQAVTTTPGLRRRRVP